MLVMLVMVNYEEKNNNNLCLHSLYKFWKDPHNKN